MLVNVGKKLLQKLSGKQYREAYVEQHVKTGVAYQIKGLREDAGLSQMQAGVLLGKPQSVISRLEDPDYGKLTVQTLLEVAAKFDVALLIRFVSFNHFLEETRDVSSEALRVKPFNMADLSGPPPSPLKVNSPFDQSSLGTTSNNNAAPVFCFV